MLVTPVYTQFFRCLTLLAAGLIGSFSAPVQAAELTAREAYALGQICSYCHARTGTTAPIIADTQQWQRRAENGFEALVHNTVVGIGNMPPLGTCGYCTETEIRNLVKVISGLTPEALPQNSTP
ncbi:MAG: cytochrome c5 family protein [Gammaproteobacteria bacterium]|jgi:cytochrome c5|nr:cytochrome c5 family protein [Gammaproteobacteria bacterium]